MSLLSSLIPGSTALGVPAVGILIAGLFVAGPMSAQRGIKSISRAGDADAARDPYTGNDPKKMKALGYLSFGPFPWDRESRSTQAIARALGDPHIRWIETAHFKFGCALAAREVPGETRLRAKVKAELRQLKKKLPKIKSTTRRLDRWLLAHLYAQRLENVYADFSKMLGVEDADFPRLDRLGTSDHYMGEGKYLGQREKFCVILFDRKTQLLRYLQAFAEYTGTAALPVRHEFSRIGSLAFATASQCHGGMLYGEVHMHAHLAGEVVKNLASGYKANMIRLPNWWCEGLGHWYSRKVDPKIVLMDETIDPNQFKRDGWNWEKRVRARVKNYYYPSTEELFDTHDFTEWKVQEHMMAWSRFEFLLKRDAKGVRRFLDYFNDLDVPIRDANEPRHRKLQIAAIQKAWAMDFDEFDTQWKKHVQARYSK
jgi:hypothetical protein